MTTKFTLGAYAPIASRYTQVISRNCPSRIDSNAMLIDSEGYIKGDIKMERGDYCEIQFPMFLHGSIGRVVSVSESGECMVEVNGETYRVLDDQICYLPEELAEGLM